ncbi:MAG: hypothetical protein ACI9VR_003614 [Cognaticolwellia sp.]|jgi:hypothetical protein
MTQQSKTEAHRPLDEEEREELDWLIEAGATLLTEWGLMPQDPTDSDQLHAAVLQAIADKRIEAENVDDAAFALGALWGDALCAGEGLEWVALEDGHALAPAKKKSKALPRRVFEELRALMLG